jgi:hypothetical protein
MHAQPLARSTPSRNQVIFLKLNGELCVEIFLRDEPRELLERERVAVAIPLTHAL